MLKNDRLKELRLRADLRQEDMCFLLGVGIASINRWERAGGTLPTGLPRQVYDVMDVLDARGVNLKQVARLLSTGGNMAAVRWLLNTFQEQ